MKNSLMLRISQIALLLVSVTSLAFFASAASAQTTEDFESIDAYKVDITMNPDSSLTVTETIDYNFHDLERHGIFRYIPVKYDAGSYNRSISIDVDSVTVDGEDVNWEDSNEGNNLRIKIGDADILVSGLKQYVITYTVDGALNYFEDHDELYWNAIGGDWPAGISNAETDVHFPAVTSSQVQYKCFSGPGGSTSLCDNSEKIDLEDGTSTEVQFKQSAVNQGDFMTIVVGLPKGIFHQPNIIQKIVKFMLDNWSYFIPFLVLIFMTFLWWTRGRDPKGRGTIIAEYEAPDNLTPVEVGTLYDETAHNHDVSAEIIYLATKGYVKITQIPKEGLLGKTDYRLDLLKPYEDLPLLDQKLLSKIFTFGTDGENGVLRTVRISELKEKFHKELAEYTTAVYQDLVDKRYFPSSPAKVKAKYFGIGGFLVFFGFWLGFVPQIIVSGIIIALFGLIMGKRTKEGAEVTEKIKGLKLFLEVTEKERIKFHNAPEKNPQLFEKFLPYAMVLHVEKQWAGQFAEMYLEQPNWYSSTSQGTFNALYLTNSLNDFSSQSSSNMAANPAASGSSGFGGGGFSGGGGGGGGGGSW